MEKLELTFSYLIESDLEEVAKLYDAERLVVTNLNKMKQTFKKIKIILLLRFGVFVEGMGIED